MLRANVVTLNGTEYPMAANLRVAYKLQNENNHRPYLEVLGEVGGAVLEKQLDFLYLAFQVANAGTTITKEQFRETLLDTYEISQLMSTLKNLVGTMLGKDLDEVSDKPTE